MTTFSAEQHLIVAFTEHADDLFRHCFLRTLSREDSKEIVQDAFVKAREYLQDAPEFVDVRAFLYRIANSIVQEKRRSVRWWSWLSSAKAPAENIAGQEALLSLLQSLSARERDVIVMRYIDEFDAPMIATVLGESISVVLTQLDAGRKLLSSRMFHDR